MGITGLLPIVKPAIASKSLKLYKSKKIGIDGHVWLHQILPNLAIDIYEGKEISKHIPMFLARVKYLKDLQIIPIIVFDGGSLPSKEKTNKLRRENRERYRLEVEDLLKKGRKTEAKDLMKRCVYITENMFCTLLRALQAENIEYIVSPYESDAQLYHLERINYIDAILTEDSDLIPYGAKRILFKLSGGKVDEFDRSKLKKIGKFFEENILDICILSGCDYLSSIKGVGLKTTIKKLEEFDDVREFVAYIGEKKEVPDNYLDEFARAKLTFLHHIVYDPNLEKNVHLNPTNTDFEFLGNIKPSLLVFKSKVTDDINLNRHFSPTIFNKIDDEVEVKEILQSDK